MNGAYGNEYGLKPLYDVGDSVRVWPIFRNPVGTVERIVDAKSFPIKYSVKYQYHTGDWYTETFAMDDLTLVKRVHEWYCNCHTANSDKHASWCNRYNSKR